MPLGGSFATLVLLTAPFLLTSLGLGLLASTLIRTQQQAMMASTFLMMVPMIYLSGLIFPIENMCDPIQVVTVGSKARPATASDGVVKPRQLGPESAAGREGSSQSENAPKGPAPRGVRLGGSAQERV